MIPYKDCVKEILTHPWFQYAKEEHVFVGNSFQLFGKGLKLMVSNLFYFILEILITVFFPISAYILYCRLYTVPSQPSPLYHGRYSPEAGDTP